MFMTQIHHSTKEVMVIGMTYASLTSCLASACVISLIQQVATFTLALPALIEELVLGARHRH